MILVIPWRTDALVEHLPWGTAGLILANVLVAVFLGFAGYAEAGFWGPPEPLPANRWGIQSGTIDPVTWVTSFFVHGGWIHLGGNMLFLWVFGLVVEGAVGWRKFLPLYLGVGAAEAAMSQLLLLSHADAVVAGASAAIYGLMAVALLWSPLNRITAFIFILFVPFWNHEIRVIIFGLFFLIWQGCLVLLSGFAMNSALFHVCGALIALPVGLLFLKRGWVDCEGWDLPSVWRRRHERRPPIGVARGDGSAGHKR